MLALAEGGIAATVSERDGDTFHGLGGAFVADTVGQMFASLVCDRPERKSGPGQRSLPKVK